MTRIAFPAHLVLFLASLLLSMASGLQAQAPPAGGGTGASATASSSPSAIGRDTSPINPENTLEMSNPQQDAKFKLFQQVPENQFAKKIALGEDFLRTYKDSPYRQPVFAALTVTYIQAGQPEKGYAAGANAIELDPNDIRTMAVLCQTMARLYSSGAPDAAQRLASAERYGSQAVQTAAFLKKPVHVSDQEFNARKNDVLAMAHSGLGLVDLRKGNYPQAIVELEQAIRMDNKKDPTNLYLLGVANQNSSHFEAAAEAFSRCASLPGNLQETCKQGMHAAKTRASQTPSPAK